MTAVAAGTGVTVALGGTMVHRLEAGAFPAGLLLALVIAVVGAVFARAAGGAAAVLAYGLAGMVMVQLLTFVRPGDDVLVTAELLSYVWLLGIPLAAVAAALTPRGWYAGSAVGPGGGASAPPPRDPTGGAGES